MSRFYLHLFHQGGTVTDDEGSDARDLQDARSIAVRAIRDILGEDAQSGSIDLGGRVDITNSEGVILMQVPFDEALFIAFT